MCRNKLSMRRKKKKKNLLRGPPYNKPEEKYGSPEDLVNWSKEKGNKKEAKKLLAIRMVMLEGERIGFNGIARLNGITVRTLHNKNIT